MGRTIRRPRLLSRHTSRSRGPARDALILPMPDIAAGAAGSGEPRFQIHDTVADQLEFAWRDLAESTARGYAARPAYALTWHQKLGKGRLAVATVHRGGELVALLPLETRRRLGLRVHRWLGHGLGTVGEALFRTPADLSELVHGLQKRGVVLELTHLREDDPLLRALQISGEWKVNFVVDDHCSVIDLPPGSTAATLRSSKTLGQLRRARAKIEREFGPLEERILRTPAELDRCWPDMVEVARRSREADPNSRLNLFDGKYAEFSRVFLRGEAEQGHLCVVAGIVNGQWGSFDVLLQTAGLAELWFTRFDPRFKAAKPGHQLLRYISDNHDELGIATFDAMIGLNAYKQEWATSGYEVGSLLAAPRKRAGLLFLVVQINLVYRFGCRVVDWVQKRLAERTLPDNTD